MPEGRHIAVIDHRVSTQDHIECTDLHSLISHEARGLDSRRPQSWHHLRTDDDPARSASHLKRPPFQRVLRDSARGAHR